MDQERYIIEFLECYLNVLLLMEVNVVSEPPRL